MLANVSYRVVRPEVRDEGAGLGDDAGSCERLDSGEASKFIALTE